MSRLAFVISFLVYALAQAADFNALVVGDTGKGNEGQYQVGRALGTECDRNQCEFVLMMGDNFYDAGVESPTDPQFVEKFERPYATVRSPFYVVLGNHDYGTMANQWKKGDYQIQYSRANPKYILPSHYYSFEHENVLFIVLDTSRLFHDKDTQKQTDFVKQALRTSRSKWTVVLTHHPYISNGQHGNAGRYDGVPFPPYSGSLIKNLFEREICPYVDLVVSGHDHSLQTLPGNAACPRPVFVVSGGGASVREDLKGKNPAHFQKAILGFSNLKFTDSFIEISQHNVNGQVEHSHRIVK